MFHSVTGTPLKTEENPKKAIELIAEELGISKKQAKYELSKTFRASSGTHAVDSWSDKSSGPLNIDLATDPGYLCYFIGSFPASRTPERSEAPEFDFMDVLNEEIDPLLELVEALQR